MVENKEDLVPLTCFRILFDTPRKVEEELTALYFQLRGCEIEKPHIIPFEDSDGNRLIIAVVIYKQKNPVA